MIKIDPDVLDDCIGQLDALASERCSVAGPIDASRGQAAETALQYHGLLHQIASTDLPSLFRSSALVLQAVKTSFVETDQQLSQSF